MSRQGGRPPSRSNVRPGEVASADRGGKNNKGNGGLKRRQYFSTDESHAARRRKTGNDGAGDPETVDLKVIPGLDPYFKTFADLVDHEVDEETKNLIERLRAWPLERLRTEGAVLLDLSARLAGRMFGDIIVKVSMPDGTLPFHRFSQGDMVTFTRTNPLDHVAFEGCVLNKSPAFLSVLCKRTPGDLRDGVWRMDKGSNKLASERMKAALKYFVSSKYEGPVPLRTLLVPTAIESFDRKSAKAQQQAGAAIKAATTAMPDDKPKPGAPPPSKIKVPVVLGTSSVDSIARKMKRQCDAKALFVKLTAPSDHDKKGVKTESDAALADIRALSGHDIRGRWALNESQSQAVVASLSTTLSLIHGPPGTGKTSTAVRLISAWRKANPEKGPVLVVAQSHVAVDQLLSGLIAAGVRAVRIGQTVRVSHDMRKYSLDAILHDHPKMAEVNEKRETIQSISADMRKMDAYERSLAQRDIGKLSAEARELELQLSMEIVSQTEVVCSTCIGAGSELLMGSLFELVVVDEATQCSEPEALVGLARAHRDAQIVMIGDHQQLPPTVISNDKRSRDLLGRSLFERLVDLMDSVSSSNCSLQSVAKLSPLIKMVKSSMLRIQYRMHPAISHWPSSTFYHGRLVDGVSARDRRAVSGFPWPAFVADVMPEKWAVGSADPNLTDVDLSGSEESADEAPAASSSSSSSDSSSSSSSEEGSSSSSEEEEEREGKPDPMEIEDEGPAAVSEAPEANAEVDGASASSSPSPEADASVAGSGDGSEASGSTPVPHKDPVIANILRTASETDLGSASDSELAFARAYIREHDEQHGAPMRRPRHPSVSSAPGQDTADAPSAEASAADTVVSAAGLDNADAPSAQASAEDTPSTPEAPLSAGSSAGVEVEMAQAPELPLQPAPGSEATAPNPTATTVPPVETAVKQEPCAQEGATVGEPSETPADPAGPADAAAETDHSSLAAATPVVVKEEVLPPEPAEQPSQPCSQEIKSEPQALLPPPVTATEDSAPAVPTVSTAHVTSPLRCSTGATEAVSPSGTRTVRVPVAVVDVADGAEKTSDGGRGSKYNREEVKVVVRTAKNLLRHGVKPSSVGIITPYAAQAQEIAAELRRQGLHSVTDRDRNDQELSEGFEVKTVDGYQGREKDVIIFSAVRANREGHVGFLADSRRCNVALTRARKGLVVICHAGTLRHSEHWKSFLDWAQEMQLFVPRSQV